MIPQNLEFINDYSELCERQADTARPGAGLAVGWEVARGYHDFPSERVN